MRRIATDFRELDLRALSNTEFEELEHRVAVEATRRGEVEKSRRIRAQKKIRGEILKLNDRLKKFHLSVLFVMKQDGFRQYSYTMIIMTNSYTCFDVKKEQRLSSLPKGVTATELNEEGEGYKLFIAAGEWLQEEDEELQERCFNLQLIANEFLKDESLGTEITENKNPPFFILKSPGFEWKLQATIINKEPEFLEDYVFKIGPVIYFSESKETYVLSLPHGPNASLLRIDLFSNLANQTRIPKFSEFDDGSLAKLSKALDDLFKVTLEAAAPYNTESVGGILREAGFLTKINAHVDRHTPGVATIVGKVGAFSKRVEVVEANKTYDNGGDVVGADDETHDNGDGVVGADDETYDNGDDVVGADGDASDSSDGYSAV